jgi:anti-sigma factor RsiW
MNEDSDLPPLPAQGNSGPQVCAVIQLYLALLDDLSPEQVQAVSRHLDACTRCMQELQRLQRATRLVASLPASLPSPRVDQAVLAALTTRQEEQVQPQLRLSMSPRRAKRQARPRLLGRLAAVVVLVLAILTGIHLFGLPAPGGGPAFALPATLAWSSYVVYHSQMRIAGDGTPYQIDTYHDLGTGRLHVETVMDDMLDVVVIGDEHAMLGKDMMHHIAQWGATAWSVDDSAFDLAHLRQALQARSAVYLGIGRFHGQNVYRIRYHDGLVLLLDMQYKPVNLLRGADGSTPGESIYAVFKLMPVSQVPASMWDMHIPLGFHLGTLPQKPGCGSELIAPVEPAL